jgi:hypothetical protein
VRTAFRFHGVRTMDEVLAMALLRPQAHDEAAVAIGALPH